RQGEVLAGGERASAGARVSDRDREGERARREWRRAAGGGDGADDSRGFVEGHGRGQFPLGDGGRGRSRPARRGDSAAEGGTQHGRGQLHGTEGDGRRLDGQGEGLCGIGRDAVAGRDVQREGAARGRRSGQGGGAVAVVGEGDTAGGQGAA